MPSLTPTESQSFAYANMPTLQMCQDDEVIWHVWSMGSFNDGFVSSLVPPHFLPLQVLSAQNTQHSAHWHGNNVQTGTGINVAQISLLPASMTTHLMNAGNIGLWQFLCHVGAHWDMGMQVNYNVSRTGSTPSCPAKSSSTIPLPVPLASAVASI